MKKGKVRRSRRELVLVAVIAVTALMLSVFMAACGSSDEAMKDETRAVAVEQKETKETTEDASKETTEETTEERTENITEEITQASTEASTRTANNNTKTENKASVDEAVGAATKATEEKKAVCYITIDGYCSGKEIEMQGGDSVYDILRRSGAVVSARSTGYGVYVEAINGRAEFDEGPTSGWKYSVNGAEPGYGCDSYAVKSGDQISWYYVLEP